MAEVSNAERKYVKVIPVSKNLRLQTALTKAFPTFFFMVAQKRQTKCKSFNTNAKIIVCLFMMRQAYVPRVETQASHLHPVLPNICHSHPNASTNKTHRI